MLVFFFFFFFFPFFHPRVCRIYVSFPRAQRRLQQDWDNGKLCFHYLDPLEATASEWEELQMHRRVLACIGIVHCQRTRDLRAAFTEFTDHVRAATWSTHLPSDSDVPSSRCCLSPHRSRHYCALPAATLSHRDRQLRVRVRATSRPTRRAHRHSGHDSKRRQRSLVVLHADVDH